MRESASIDKDFPEVTALEQVWPTAEIQTCLWHRKKAVSRRLRTAANAQRVSYIAKEVQYIIPGVDLNWFPLGAVAPKRTLRNPLSASHIPLPSSFHTPHAPTSSTTTPRIVLSRNSEATYLDSANAPTFSSEILAQMRQMEYDEDEDNDVDDSGRGEVDPETGAGGGVERVADGEDGEEEEGGKTTKKRRKLQGKGTLHGEVNTM